MTTKIDYDNETNMMMAALAYMEVLLEKLCFFDTNRLFYLKELVNIPINLIRSVNTIKNSVPSEKLFIEKIKNIISQCKIKKVLA